MPPANLGSRLDADLDLRPFPHLPRGTLSRSSRIIAIIPHFHCESWLGACLASLVEQTRPLDGIVVVDDGSGDPPVDLVERFPQVTLLASAENVGPYRLSQEVISRTDADGYLFQDADDWSAPDRLELLLAEAERSGAELIGCQGIRILCEEMEAVSYTQPLDANAMLAMQPTSNPVHHPTSLVSRDLVTRVGGFATGLRYSGDTEFLRRAGHVARIVNIPNFSYFYRTRPGSLTSDEETGNRSRPRLELRAVQHERALANAALVAEGRPPDLAPMATAPPLPLTYLLGPTLGVDWDNASTSLEDADRTNPRPSEQSHRPDERVTQEAG